MIDLDATLVTAHSDKEGAAGNFKGGFGYHPLGAWLDNTGEALACLLRPGNAGSNTAADHLTVLGLAAAQLPDRWRDKAILIRADGAGASHALVAGIATRGWDFSVGFAVTAPVRAAIGQVPDWAWNSACNADGDLREHADVVEVTGLLDPAFLRCWQADCPAVRVLVRRERPHPGAQLDAFEERDGYRYQAMLTNTGRGQLAFLDARHRAHARVEDRIRTGKDTGLSRLPSRHEHINAVWLELSLIAADLLALAQSLLLTDEPDLARPNPRRCATGCCTSPPASPEDSARSSCGWPSTGLGAGARPSLPAPAAHPAASLTGQHHHATPTTPPPPGPRRHRPQRRRSVTPSSATTPVRSTPTASAPY